MGNPSPGSKLKKTTTPSKTTTSHRHPPSSSATLPGSLDRLGKQDVASPEKGSNGAGKSVASSTAGPGGGGGSGEKGTQSPAVKDVRVIRRRSRSSLGGTDDFVQLGIDFNQGNPPADEKVTGPPVEEKKHPFLLARGGLGRNGVRSGSPSQPMQSPGAKQCTTSTPPGKEKTARARAGSGSTSVLSPRKLDMTSRKAEKEHSLTEIPTAKRVEGDSVVIGRSKQNRSVKLQGTGKLVPTEKSCPLLASTDVLHPSKPDLDRRLISEGLASEVLTRPEIPDSVELPAYSNSKEVDHVQNDHQQFPTSDTEEKRSSVVCPKLPPSLNYAQLGQLSLVSGINSETSSRQDEENPTCSSLEEMSNVEDNHKALHSSDPGECTSASIISISSLSAQVVPWQQEGQVVTPDVEVRTQGMGCLPLEKVVDVENLREEELDSADTDEIKLALQALQSFSSELACEQQGWNEGDIEEPIVSAVNDFSIYQAPNNIRDVQDKKADLQITDSRQSASIHAISSEAAFEDILEEFRANPETRIPTGFLSDNVLYSSDLFHTSVNLVNFTEVDTNSDALPAHEQEAVELLSHTSLEGKSVTLDVDKDRGIGKDLAKADSLLMVLPPDSVCHSAQSSGSMHDSNQELTAATMMKETLVYPSKSHPDVLGGMEEDLHAVGTHSESAACSPDASQVIMPPEHDQEMHENKMSTCQSGLQTDSLGSKHDIPSEEIIVPPNATKEIDIQSQTSAMAQESELDVEERTSVTDANQEHGATSRMTSMVFAISPHLDTSHAIYHVSPMPCPKQEPEATSGNIRPASFTLGKLVTSNLGLEGSVSKQESSDIFLEPDSGFHHHSSGPESSQELEPATSSFNEEISSSLDDEGAAMNHKELPSSTPDAGDGEDAFELEKYPEREESATNVLVLPNIPQVNPVQLDQESSVALNSFQKSPAADHSVEMRSDNVIATFISSKGNKDLVEAAVSKVETCEDSADGMMDLSGSLEPLDCQMSANCISPKLQELPEEGVTSIPKSIAYAEEEATNSFHEGNTASLLDELLDCAKFENSSTSLKINHISKEGLTENGAGGEEVIHNLDNVSAACLHQEASDCQNTENCTSQQLQSSQGVMNSPEGVACAEEAADIVDEGSTACLLREPLDCPESQNYPSPEIHGVSQEGVADTCKNSACAADTTDNVDAGSTIFCLRQPLVFQNPEDNTAPNIQEVSEEGVTNVPENYAYADDATDSVEEWNTACVLQESLDFPESENSSSSKIQVSDEGVTDAPENGELATDIGCPSCSLQEPLSSLKSEYLASQDIRVVEGITNISEKGALVEDATDKFDEGSKAYLLQETPYCPNSENSTSPEFQAVAEDKVTNGTENAGCAEVAAGIVEEGSTRSLLQEPLDGSTSGNNSSPEIHGFSEQGVTDAPENDAGAEGRPDLGDDGSTAYLPQELVNCPKSTNITSPKIHQVSEEEVTAPAENDSLADKVTGSADGGSRTCLLEETGSNSLQVGFGAPLILVKAIQEETELAAQKDLMPADGGPVEKLPYTPGIGRDMTPMTENAHHLNVDTQDDTKGVTIHQGLGVGEKVSSTTEQDLPAYEASIDTDKKIENLEGVVGHGVAPSPMKHQETRATRMAGSDAIFVVEAGKSTGNTDGVLGSAVEDMNKQLKEKLDNVEGLEVKCLTEEDPGILEEEKSPKSGLFLNTLASSEGPLSLRDPVFDTSDVAEELVAYNKVSEQILDMSEDDRVVMHILPEISTEHSAMGVSSYSDNVMRGEHQAEPGYLGLGSCERTEVVQRPGTPRENILHKQEEEKADKIATDILPILETTTAPTLQDKTVFPSEETKVEAVEEEVNPLAREVYIEAYPVDILGDEEYLNCLDELPTAETSDMLVRTADIPEGLIPAANLEVLEDDRSETEVNDRLLRSPAEQTFSSVVESGSAWFKTNHAPVTQENSVAPTTLVAHDCVVRDINPGNEVEESEHDQDSVSQGGSCISTELIEKPAKSGGFEGAHDMDEQGTQVATDLATQLNSQLQTKCVLSEEDSSSSQAEETLSHENAGEMVNTVSWHTLVGVSPVYAIGGNEDETKSAETDPSLDGNNSSVNLGSAQETVAESVDFSKSNKLSQDNISHDGVQAQKSDPVAELSVLDGREPCNQDNHDDDANESERADMSNNALPLLDSRKPKEYSFEVSQASSTNIISDEVQAIAVTEMHRDSSTEVMQVETADQDQSSIAWKDLALPEKPWSMMTTGQSARETAKCQEPAASLLPVLEQHPLSSSHQDHLLVEETEVFSSGGRETPACLEDFATNGVQSGAATSLDDQILPASGPVENTLSDAMACSSMVENGSTNEGKTGKGKARTPLRSLLAEDASKVPLPTGLVSSPLKRLFSRLMGTTKSGDKDIKQVRKKKPSAWNICLGDSAVQIGHKNHYG
ncbi:unnamed protein product [Sphagnum compactum]